jgi:hypothetical protein
MIRYYYLHLGGKYSVELSFACMGCIVHTGFVAGIGIGFGVDNVEGIDFHMDYSFGCTADSEVADNYSCSSCNLAAYYK